MIFLKKVLPLIFIFVFSFFAFKPLLNPGFFPIHDNTQVARVYEMSKALKDGMFPVRWVADLGYGYGYPIFNFYDPLPYYVGSTIGFFGVDALFATKLMMFLGVILAGFSMYFLAKEFWGNLGGVFASLFYMYAPYHAVDVYVRGDVAEFWAYSFIPLIFYGLWKIYKEKKWRYVIVASLSYSALIISHNLTAMMVTPFLILFAFYLFSKSKKRERAFIIMSFVTGILIAAFYWIPAIFEMKYTNVLSQIGGGADFKDHFVCLSQLWTGIWGYGGSVKGCSDGISFMIGKYHIILSLIIFAFSIFILVSKKYLKQFEREKIIIIVLSFLGFLISIFFTLEISKSLWELFSPMAFIQYPWRFLIMIVFFSSFIAGALFWISGKLIKNNLINYGLGFLLFCFIVLVSAKFFVPQTILNKTSSDFTNDYSLKWTTSRISDEYMPKDFLRPKEYYQIPDISNLKTAALTTTIVKKKTQELNLKLDVRKSGSYILPVAYFPAWKGSLDGKNISLIPDKRGILVSLPYGEHNLILSFRQTLIESSGDLLTFAGILVLVAGIIKPRIKHE